MTSTQQPTRATRFIATLGETIPTLTRTQRAATMMVDCHDCLSVDDPADCPTCGGERYIATAA